MSRERESKIARIDPGRNEATELANKSAATVLRLSGRAAQAGYMFSLQKTLHRSTQGLRSETVVAAAICLGLTACPMTEDDDSGADEGGTPTSSMSIGGTVSRSPTAEIALGNDGVGLLAIAAFADCTLDAELLGAAAIPNADLAEVDAVLDWTISDLPASTAYLAFFLDDNGDADSTVPRPGPGDILFADGIGDGMLSCVEVQGGDLDVELELNATIPWP